MSSYADDAATIAKSFRRDEARKHDILARFPQLGYAMDAGEISARELATRALQSCGLKVPSGADPLLMLDMYLLGRSRRMQLDAGMKPAGMDSAGESFLDKYLAN